MTLNQLCDDVLLEARNNNIAESEKLSRRQIELWIKSYRAMLIKQKLDKKENLDDMFTQTIRMHVDKIENDPGHIEYMGDKELPTLLNTKWFTGLISVKDAYKQYNLCMCTYDTSETSSQFHHQLELYYHKHL